MVLSRNAIGGQGQRRDQEVRNLFRLFEPQQGHREPRWLEIGNHRDPFAGAARAQGLGMAAAQHFERRQSGAAIRLDEDQVQSAAKQSQTPGEVRLGPRMTREEDGGAGAREHQAFGARFAQAPGILAGLVRIRESSGVLDHSHAEAARAERPDHAFEQAGLADPAVAGERHRRRRRCSFAVSAGRSHGGTVPSRTVEVILLGSGSTGNCALVRAGSGADAVTVVLDCGLAQRTARVLAEQAGASLTHADAVLLTHHHTDHSANVVPVAARAGAPLYAHLQALARHPKTSASERARRRVETRGFLAGEAFSIGPLRCLPVRIDHDADPTHGFVFEADGRRAGFFTDLGVTDALETGVLEGLDLLVLEFNHDPELLRAGPYPPHLQARVGGPLGHLANEQAGDLLAAHAPRGLLALALAHLSLKNNTPQLAIQAAERGLAARGLAVVAVSVAPARGVLRLAAP